MESAEGRARGKLGYTAGRKIVSYLSRTISSGDRLKTNSETTREEIDSLSLSLSSSVNLIIYLTFNSTSIGNLLNVARVTVHTPFPVAVIRDNAPFEIREGCNYFFLSCQSSNDLLNPKATLQHHLQRFIEKKLCATLVSFSRDEQKRNDSWFNMGLTNLLFRVKKFYVMCLIVDGPAEALKAIFAKIPWSLFYFAAKNTRFLSNKRLGGKNNTRIALAWKCNLYALVKI